ncbi:MAG: sigma-70 family RNA polymerase sigma factor [Phycisphaerae bacterium]|nr:sigma-70 family RNA polymerase sigma factor [Phycisphaerae bacterium]
MAAYLDQAMILEETGTVWRLLRERLQAGVDTASDRPRDDQATFEGRCQALDRADIRESLGGDPAAYRRLVERHQAQVSKILWRFSRDRRVHEELVQDTFVEAYLSLRGFKGTAPFSHWLARIATRVGYQYWKQASRPARTWSLTVEEWDRLADTQVSTLQAGEVGALVHRLLEQLPPRDRLVLTLRYLEGCDVAQTARRIGWTQSMVKVQTLRARKKLEKLLASHDKESLL